MPCERPPRLRGIKVASRLFIDRASTPPHEEGKALRVAIGQRNFETPLDSDARFAANSEFLARSSRKACFWSSLSGVSAAKSGKSTPAATGIRPLVLNFKY